MPSTMPVEMVRGGVTPTITGDHETRVTDYTAIAVLEITPAYCPEEE